MTDFSSQPKEWLSVKVLYLLTELRYLEYGLQSQVRNIMEIEYNCSLVPRRLWFTFHARHTRRRG